MVDDGIGEGAADEVLKVSAGLVEREVELGRVGAGRSVQLERKVTDGVCLGEVSKSVVDGEGNIVRVLANAAGFEVIDGVLGSERVGPQERRVQVGGMQVGGVQVGRVQVGGMQALVVS